MAFVMFLCFQYLYYTLLVPPVNVFLCTFVYVSVPTVFAYCYCHKFLETIWSQGSNPSFNAQCAASSRSMYCCTFYGLFFFLQMHLLFASCLLFTCFTVLHASPCMFVIKQKYFSCFRPCKLVLSVAVYMRFAVSSCSVSISTWFLS